MSNSAGPGSDTNSKMPVDGLGDPLPEGAVQRLGTARMTYPTGTVSFCYLPGDRALVANGPSLEVLDLARGTSLERHTITPNNIVAFACERTGAIAAFITREGDVVIWNLTEGRELRRWHSGQATLSHVSISPDGERVLATGQSPPTLKEWDLESGHERIAIEGPQESFFLHVYHKAEGATAQDGTTIPTPVQFSMGIYGPDGATAFVGDSAQTSLMHYDLRTGRLLHQWYPDAYTRQLALSPDGERLLIGSRHRATEWALDGYRFLNVFTGHHGHEATAVAYCRDPDQILTGSRDGSIRLWNRLDSTVKLRWVAHQRYVTALAVSPDHHRCLSFGAGSLVESDLKTGKPRLEWDRHRAPVLAVAWLPPKGIDDEEKQIASSSADGTIRLWNMATGKTVRQFVLPTQGLTGYALAIAPDGRRLVVGGYAGIWEFDLNTGSPTRELKGHRGWVRALAYTPDGQRLLSSADDGAIVMWSPQAVEASARLEGHRGGVLALAISSDGTYALSGGRDGTVRLWDLRTLQPLKTCVGHEGWVEAVAFGADHRHAHSSGRDGRVLMWDMNTAAITREMNHGEWVHALTCSRDGKMVCSAGKNGRIIFWDAISGRERARLSGHTSDVLALALSSNGQHLVSASHDNTLLIWRSAVGAEPASSNNAG